MDGIKRKAILVVVTNNIIISETDRKRANDCKVILLDENDITYYETIVNHVGKAAKYQLFADLLDGQKVPGLAITIPAIKSKMGVNDSYSFSIAPDYLLKICYVSHRLKGKASETDAYQRMVQKSRLKNIRKYISDGGTFPTNIIINLEKAPTFQKSGSELVSGETTLGGGTLGYLQLKSSYKSAWIIDGQHRMYAFSGHPLASKSTVSVLAFVNMPAHSQAKLFTDINSEQKSVSQSLLRELYAELNWGNPDVRKRVQAVASKAAQVLGDDKDSPLFRRVKSSDAPKTFKRCITNTSIGAILETRGFYIVAEKDGHVVEYGPLWPANGENDEALRRTVYIVKEWFKLIISLCEDWWELGSEPGGGLSMNDGVTVCLKVLKSIFDFLDERGMKLRVLSDKELIDTLKPYGEAMAYYLGGLTVEQRQQFREKRGVQGQTRASLLCQQAIHTYLPEFCPSLLKEFMDRENARTNERTMRAISEIKEYLQIAVVQTLQNELGDQESQWWMSLPKVVRNRVNIRYEEDKAQKGNKEVYFDLSDYAQITRDLWLYVESELPISRTMSKTAFLRRLNDLSVVEKKLSSKANQDIVSVDIAEGAEKLSQTLSDYLNNSQEKNDEEDEDT